MDANVLEALRAREIAEKRFAERDYAGAKKYAAKAKSLCPGIEGISQMVSTYEVYHSSTIVSNGEYDYYSILGVKPSADNDAVRKQYRKMAVLLHPDKNKTAGADGAFKLITEAWKVLSDTYKRNCYDLKRNMMSSHSSGVQGFPTIQGLDTFWTVCTSCKVQYEYLRKYVNKRLSCKNCRSTFVAVETGTAPVNGSFPYSSWTYPHGHVYGHPHPPPSFTFQWNGYSGYPGTAAIPAADLGNSQKVKTNGSFLTKSGKPDKRRKVVVEEKPMEVDTGIAETEEAPARQSATAPAFDGRKLLIEMARNSIRKKLEEYRIASEVVVCKSVKMEGGKGDLNRVSITVPDPDFHDFDRDRTEECFRAKQIWAIYDEDDGMPRLYCLVREVLCTNPFKILISYLNAKTDAEFGSVNWVESGFTKSCGNFRAYNSDVVEQVNIFSHLLKGEKAGRGGCVRIYPKSGEIWAVYRNWSPEWSRATPSLIRHQYEMVEVLENYNEDYGVCIAPLMKLPGYKTVYQRDVTAGARRWVRRNEMVRFSHQVPSWPLGGGGEGSGLPEKCWDLDPAATPDELLHSASKD